MLALPDEEETTVNWLGGDAVFQKLWPTVVTRYVNPSLTRTNAVASGLVLGLLFGMIAVTIPVVVPPLPFGTVTF